MVEVVLLRQLPAHRLPVAVVALAVATKRQAQHQAVAVVEILPELQIQAVAVVAQTPEQERKAP
jgi:hypothetical protein